MREAALVATLSSPPSPGGEEIASLPPAVRWLEVRANRVGDVDPDWLRGHFAGELLYSLRGASGGAERRARLLAAAERWDLIDLGAEDLDAEILARVPAARRVLSWCGPAVSLAELRARWQQLANVPARLARLIPAAVEPADALTPLRLLFEAGRSDLTAFASGPAGWWSRLMAPRLGAPVVFAAVAEEEGEPSVARLMADYGLPAMSPVEELYGIVGPKAIRSLSPRLHNAAYRTSSLPALYVPFPAAHFGSFWSELGNGALADLGWPLRGLTVTAPFKEPALAVAAEASVVARQAGAANTLLRKNGSWRADTADADGVLSVLESRGVGVAGRQVAVVGCGGAGRAAALGLQRAGAQVTLVNRGTERARFASQLLGLGCVPLAAFDPRPFSLLVHATPLVEEPPFPVSGLARETVVVELVYGQAPTPLMAAAVARGCTAIDGRDVLLVEAQRQYRMMTGQEMAADQARAALTG
ncbi:MAG TPA: type I 3-dehydroquinate dehydratase [Thermoanaerobaculia bacterium]|jgi:3-dehydroquinate dehydratase/shikimate dehydrogenase|nr:type I 3-dehydroquinate dehydratase [Thermoanaerobaculia bacterium]